MVEWQWAWREEGMEVTGPEDNLLTWGWIGNVRSLGEVWIPIGLRKGQGS